MILKRKIAKAKLASKQRELAQEALLRAQEQPPEEKPKQPRVLKSKHAASPKYRASLKHKNVLKNYGRAICNFLLSELSRPYLEQIVDKDTFPLVDFTNYVRDKRDNLNGVTEFRSLLLITGRDNPKIRSFKKAIQGLSEVFLKYFAVNWIFDSKLEYRLDYLRCRFKVLRRVRDPENFTNIK